MRSLASRARGIYSHMFVVLSEEYFSRYYPTHLFSAIVIPRGLLITGMCRSFTLLKGHNVYNIFMVYGRTKSDDIMNFIKNENLELLSYYLTGQG